MANRLPKHTTTKMSLADAISEAYGEFQSLAEEMRNWADSLEEKFSGTDKYERVNEAADILENLQEPEIPEKLRSVEIEITKQNYSPSRLRRLSRADRCGDAVTILDQCIQLLCEYGVTSPQDNPDPEAGDLSSELDNHKQEAEAIEFPGMYG